MLQQVILDVASRIAPCCNRSSDVKFLMGHLGDGAAVGMGRGGLQGAQGMAPRRVMAMRRGTVARQGMATRHVTAVRRGTGRRE